MPQSQERFNGVTTMKAKTLTKIMSSVLCAALTMQIGWGVKTEAVNADSYETDSFLMWNYDHLDKWVNNGTVIGTSELFCYVSEDTSVLVSRSELALEVEQFATGTLGAYTTVEDGKQHRLNLQPKESVTITTITMSNSADRIFHSAGGLNCTTITNNGSHELQSGCTFSCSGTYTNNGTITLSNNDTFSCGTLSGPGTIAIGGENTTLTADTITINSGSTNNGTINVTSSLTFSGYDTSSAALGGTFVCNRDTLISSDGATFTLQVGSATKEITGTFTNKKPADLFDDPFSFGAVHDVYYGQEYDFSDLITVADGYNKSVTLEYSSDGVNYSTTKPTAHSENNYYVRAVAPDSDTFLGRTSEPQTYEIKYLEYSDLFPSGSKAYSSVSGIVNGKYVPGDLVITMPNGILIKGTTFDSDKDFSNTITLTPEVVLYDYGGVNVDETVQFRDTTNDNATTKENISIAQFYPELFDLVYDLDDPDIWLSSVDGEFVDEDITTSLTGDDLEFRIYDDNLKAIYVNGELYKSFEEGHFISPLEEDDYFPDDEEGFEPEYITLSLSSVVGKATDYTIKAVDYAGRETEFSFTLFPNTADAIVSVTTPEGTIYAGDDYTIDVKTNSDGEVTLQYKDASNNTVLSSKPTEAGTYTVTATTAKTTFYFEAKDSADFTIIKRTPETTVTVPGTIYVGSDYDVEADTDSDGSISYQYYDKDNGTYLSSKPTSAGEYTVTAKTAETTKYYSSEDTASFKIVKRDPTISLSVPDTIVGQTYAPEFVTNSDSNSITYEYKVKGSADSTYTNTKPTAAGSYTIRVTLGSTTKYNGASTTADFTISKKTPSVSLGVGTPYAGTTYTPSFSSNSDAASRAVFEYKEKNSDDNKYSTTLPTAYGEYVVRVTIPETAEYAKAVVTADYKIVYLNAPQTAYVIEGQAGKNNYFVSDVVLKAPTGYTISAVYGGPYTASIPYKDGITSVYLKRTSDNALTNAIPIANAPRVDKNAPSISTPTGNITPGSVIYTSDFTLNVSDPNLRSLKVNGEPIDLTNYKNGYSLTLNPGYGSQTYKIMAEDEAGNVTTLEFTLKAEWLKDKVIIPDVVLPLEGNESYNLGDGYWLVTRNTPSGPVTDKTVYSGNMPFYVKEGGDYTFTKVT